MGKKFARFAAAFIAIAVAISVVVPAAVSFAADDEETTYDATLQGFLEWVADDPSELFSDSQSKSATSALSWLTGSSNKVDWYDTYVDLESGANTLDALQDALTYMEAVNNIRAAEDQSELGISLKAMASAALNSYYSSNIFAHSYSYSVGSENLATSSGEYTYSSEVESLGWPFSGWYTEEKALFDAAVEEDSSLEAYRYSAYSVYSTNYSLYLKTGHYLNLVDSSTKSFGMASASGVTVWSGSTASADFTVDEFKAAVATFICYVVNDGVHEYESEVTTEATCTTDGVMTYTCSVCGDSYTETIDATGHTAGDAVIENEVEATCTEAGSYDTVVYCTVCGEELSRTTTTVAATGHSYTNYVSNSDATCTEDGTKTAECDNGCSETDTVTDEGSALGHSWDEGTVTTEPTCTETGTKTYTCENDSSHTYTEVIDALGHTAGDAVVENEISATCTEYGSYDTVVYCTVCGEELSRETVTVDALGHDYEAVVTDPTCTEQGYTTYTCSRCGDSYVDDYTDATGHSYDSGTVTTEPTCTEAGVLTYTCENDSSHTYTEVIAALGHDYVATKTTATCTEPGITTYTCSRCGDTYTETVAEALGHSWDEGTVTTEPTCTEEGVLTYTCSRCGETYTEVIAATGHTEGEAVIENEVVATCTEDGSYDSVVYCTVCDEELSRETTTVAATGHTLELVAAVAATCIEDGNIEHYECQTCGALFADADTAEALSASEVVVAATGHSWDEGTVTTEPTCTEAGVLTYTCENDASHTYTEVIAALGHTWGEGVVTEPTCTEAGYTTYTCTVCGATTTGDEVAALGHTWGEWVTISSPTCTDTGSQQRVCEVCGTVETEDLDATGHSWEDDYTVDVEPTCDTDGSQSIHCSACDAVTDSQTIAATGHSWDEGVVTATAFGSDTGEITYTCTTCGETYTVAFSYEVTSGANQTIEQGSALSATANGALDKLVSIEVDGAEVDADSYTLVSGSTVLTLSSEYVSTLELGEHTLRFVYEDGDASTTFTIVAATVEDEGDEDADADEDVDSDAETDDATDADADDVTADTETDADSDEDEDDEEIVPATGDSQALLAATVAAAGAVLVAAGMADRRRRQR